MPSMSRFIFVHTQVFSEGILLSANLIKFQIKFNKIIPHYLLSIIPLIMFSYCLPECPETTRTLDYKPGAKKPQPNKPTYHFKGKAHISSKNHFTKQK